MTPELKQDRIDGIVDIVSGKDDFDKIKYMLKEPLINLGQSIVDEAAADPALTPCLIAFGLDEFSVSPEKVLATRKNISLWSSEDAIAVADKVMALGTAEEVKQYLDSMKKEDE